MISKNALSTHAQYQEDLILLALLNEVKEGFYVDIGANDPDKDSVTKIFYNAGWTGVNIEPIRKQFELFKQKRPKDTNVCLGIGSEKGSLLFREYTDLSGHSTFSRNYTAEEPKELKYIEYNVEVITLKELFTKYSPNVHVDFLKIDVEGLEYEVIVGNDWSIYRPTVICIESNHQEEAKDWKLTLTDAGYEQFIFDGLNSYYIAKEAWRITNGYAERIVQLSHDALSEYQKRAWMEDSRQLRMLQDENQKIKASLALCQSKLQETSLWNQPLRKRIKIALIGLTIDWMRYKRKR